MACYGCALRSLEYGPLTVSGANALSPTEVFSIASPSIAVVVATDASRGINKLGSGVAIGTDSVITNCHVVQNRLHRCPDC